jgi:hypothetical protein
VVLATAPQKPGLVMPADAEVRAALTAADAMMITPPSFNPPPVARALMPDKPAPAAIRSRRELPGLA